MIYITHAIIYTLYGIIVAIRFLASTPITPSTTIGLVGLRNLIDMRHLGVLLEHAGFI